MPNDKLWEANGTAVFETDESGLPYCRLLGQRPCYYPADTPPPQGMEETDPWFILGNYGLTVFPHASGSYQLLHTERSFARLNHDGSSRITGRACRCRLETGKETIDLLEREADEKRFGCGFAEWVYRLDGLELVRRFDIVPSRDSADRIPGFRITISLRGTSDASRNIVFTEGLQARYHFANWNNPPLGRRAARYPVRHQTEKHHCSAEFLPEELLPLVFDQPGVPARADGQSIAVHMEALSAEAQCKIEQDGAESCWLLVENESRLGAGQEKTFTFIVGWSDATRPWLTTLERLKIDPADMRKQWLARLPEFPEATPAERGEMQWHAHTLHAMATWDQRYGRTFIPQGTIYEYGVGVAAVTRDHAMHALPACSYDPDLALSVLEYLARHTDARGHIQHTDEGAGVVPQGGIRKATTRFSRSCWLRNTWNGPTIWSASAIWNRSFRTGALRRARSSTASHAGCAICATASPPARTAWCASCAPT
ncbi:MAG: hypothetical protein ACOC29_01170 [Candidatus Sumerlaeota bacterium]